MFRRGFRSVRAFRGPLSRQRFQAPGKASGKGELQSKIQIATVIENNALCRSVLFSALACCPVRGRMEGRGLYWPLCKDQPPGKSHNPGCAKDICVVRVRFSRKGSAERKPDRISVQSSACIAEVADAVTAQKTVHSRTAKNRHYALPGMTRLRNGTWVVHVPGSHHACVEALREFESPLVRLLRFRLSRLRARAALLQLWLYLAFCACI